MWTTGWNDIDTTFQLLDDFRRRMDRLFEDFGTGHSPGRHSWPRTNLYDNGSELMLEALVPGLREQDVQLTATQDTIAVAGQRQPDAPEGYSAHRQERAAFQFSRSFSLPCKIDPEKVGASLKNGVLTVTMAKSAEAQPRQITVKAK
jgi:HSP20 family protein